MSALPGMLRLSQLPRAPVPQHHSQGCSSEDAARVTSEVPFSSCPRAQSSWTWTQRYCSQAHKHQLLTAELGLASRALLHLLPLLRRRLCRTGRR